MYFYIFYLTVFSGAFSALELAGISSLNVNNLIMHSCRDINAEHVAPNSPLPCNMGVPPNVEPCRASDGDNISCSPTPAWCDTQSQSVMGNEIVTQDYMVSQQLRNEEIRQAEKRIFFQRKLMLMRGRSG